MRLVQHVVLVAIMTCFVVEQSFAAKSAKEYETQLAEVGVLLSQNDQEQVREWLSDVNSAFPALADHLLMILHNSKPRGEKTVLDAIMGKYRVTLGKPATEYVAPPLEQEVVKQAYVKNWKERNQGEWNSLP